MQLWSKSFLGVQIKLFKVNKFLFFFHTWLNSSLLLYQYTCLRGHGLCTDIESFIVRCHWCLLYLMYVFQQRELQKHYKNFSASVCQISEGYVLITPCIFFIQLPELLEMIKPKLDMIGFKNIACISGKRFVYLFLSMYSTFDKYILSGNVFTKTENIEWGKLKLK